MAFPELREDALDHLSVWHPLDGPPARDTDRHGIGSGEQTTIRIPDVGASRQHCRLDYDGRQVVLTDLNSANGTWSTAAGSRHPAQP